MKTFMAGLFVTVLITSQHNLCRGQIPEPQQDQSAAPATAPVVTQTPEAKNSETEKIVLHRGTRVCLRPTKTLSSETAKRGDRVTFRLQDDLSADGLIVAPAGTAISATVTRARKGDIFFQSGKLEIQFDPLPLVDGQSVPLEKYHPQNQCKAAGRASAEDILTLVMVSPLVVPLLPFAKLADETLPENHCVDQGIARDILLDQPGATRFPTQPDLWTLPPTGAE